MHLELIWDTSTTLALNVTILDIPYKGKTKTCRVYFPSRYIYRCSSTALLLFSIEGPRNYRIDSDNTIKSIIDCGLVTSTREPPCTWTWFDSSQPMSSTEVNQQNTTVFSLSYQASTALPKWAFKFSGKTMESQGKTPSKSPPIESRNTEYFKLPLSTHAQTAIWALPSTTWSFTVTTLSLFWEKKTKNCHTALTMLHSRTLATFGGEPYYI